MNAYQTPQKLDLPTNDRRTSQMSYLCHFLEVFASGDPIMRAGAAHYGEKLREEGCSGNEVIKMAATALLIAIEHELDAHVNSDII